MAEGVLGEIAARKRRGVAKRLYGATLDAEPTQRSLRAALARSGARFIMEVKKASPSGHRSSVSVEDAADAYSPVADAISVLTDTPFFGGSVDDLRTARARYDGPILAKDFIVDPRQVTEARTHGADAVLAILAMVDDEEARAIIAEARRLSMDVIVEVHDERELAGPSHLAKRLSASTIATSRRSKPSSPSRSASHHGFRRTGSSSASPELPSGRKSSGLRRAPTPFSSARRDSEPMCC